MKLRKTSPRRLLYLVAIAICGLLGLLCSKAWLKMYKDSDKADQVYLSTHLKQDTELARYAFYANYRPKTDYIKNTALIGSNASFLNVCADNCFLLSNKKDLLNICSKLSAKYRFDQHRVYNCNITVTLENDQPLNCKAINRDIFTKFCSNLALSNGNITLNSRQKRQTITKKKNSKRKGERVRLRERVRKVKHQRTFITKETIKQGNLKVM